MLGVARCNIARHNADGTLDTTFDTKANNTVYSVAVQADGKALLGGSFTTLQCSAKPLSKLRHISNRAASK